MSKTNYLQAVISDLQRTAGPYTCAKSCVSVLGVCAHYKSDKVHFQVLPSSNPWDYIS
jgi:hypothetical protein